MRSFWEIQFPSSRVPLTTTKHHNRQDKAETSEVLVEKQARYLDEQYFSRHTRQMGEPALRRMPGCQRP